MKDRIYLYILWNCTHLIKWIYKILVIHLQYLTTLFNTLSLVKSKKHTQITCWLKIGWSTMESIVDQGCFRYQMQASMIKDSYEVQLHVKSFRTQIFVPKKIWWESCLWFWVEHPLVGEGDRKKPCLDLLTNCCGKLHHLANQPAQLYIVYKWSGTPAQCKHW